MYVKKAYLCHKKWIQVKNACFLWMRQRKWQCDWSKIVCCISEHSNPNHQMYNIKQQNHRSPFHICIQDYRNITINKIRSNIKPYNASLFFEWKYSFDLKTENHNSIFLRYSSVAQSLCSKNRYTCQCKITYFTIYSLANLPLLFMFSFLFLSLF